MVVSVRWREDCEPIASLQRVREVTRMKVGMSFGMAQTSEGKWVHVALGSREAGDATS